MKISIVLILLLHFHAIAVSHSNIIDCSYINNRTDSVEINCKRYIYPFGYVVPVQVFHYRHHHHHPIDGSSSLEEVHEETTQIPESICYNDLFKSDSKEKNRLNVKLLKPSSDCDLTDQLGVLFENIRELESTHISKYHLVNVFKHLTKLNASHQNVMIIDLMDFNNKQNLREIDYSFNGAVQFFGTIIDRNTQLAVANFSHNELNWLHESVFKGMIRLKVLDLSYNKLFFINRNTFQSNKNLEELRLDNNPLTVFDCNMIPSIKSLTSVTISLDKIEKLDLNCIGCSIGHKASGSTNEMVIRLSGIKNELHFTKEYFKQLSFFSMADNEIKNISEIFELIPTSLQVLHLSSKIFNGQTLNILDRFNNLELLILSHSNLTDLEPRMFLNKSELKLLDLSNNDLSHIRNSTDLFAPLENLQTLIISNAHIENIQDILQSVAPSAIKLDLSFNYVGKLNATTFQRFTNLQYLNLSHTNLSNFGFSTFYHLNKLQSLDLSYNNLMRVDFHLLGPSFRNLFELYLEGNNLSDISIMKSTVFPSLTTLAISKNQLSCHGLIQFLHRWYDLNLIGNPTTDQTHIDGIDCVDVDPNSNDATTKTTAVSSEKHILTPGKHEIIVTHTESHITKYSVLLLCMMCCGYLMIKSKFIPRIKEKLTNNSIVNNTTCKPATSTLGLMEQENL